MGFLVGLLDKIPFLKNNKRVVALVGLVLVGAIETIQGQNTVLEFIKPEWMSTAKVFFQFWGTFGLLHAGAKRKVNGGS